MMSTDAAPLSWTARSATSPRWVACARRSPVPSPARVTTVAVRPAERSAAASGSREFTLPPYPGTRRTGPGSDCVTGDTDVERARTTAVTPIEISNRPRHAVTNTSRRRCGERASSTISDPQMHDHACVVRRPQSRPVITVGELVTDDIAVTAPDAGLGCRPEKDQVETPSETIGRQIIDELAQSGRGAI